MIYEAYTTHVHDHETQIKKWTFLYLLKSVSFQGRNQDLNRLLQNFDNDIIIMTLTSLSWHQGKHEKF